MEEVGWKGGSRILPKVNGNHLERKWDRPGCLLQWKTYRGVESQREGIQWKRNKVGEAYNFKFTGLIT